MSDFEPRRPGEIPTLETRAEAEQTVNKMKRYEQIVTAMKTLGEDMTVDNFNHHVYTAREKK